MERKELFRAVVGSKNYNLNTKGSDTDYKVFLLPSFDDLYQREQFHKSLNETDQDVEFHDVRKLSSLFWKSNVNFLEVPFSSDIFIQKDLSKPFQDGLYEVFQRKEAIARMNLPYLYRACVGMYYQKHNRVLEGRSIGNTNHLVEAYQYDTKEAMHSLRVLDLLIRYEQQGFTDFKKAICYADREKQWLINIKEGEYLLEVYMAMAKDLKEAVDKIKEKYMTSIPDHKLKNDLEKIVETMVRENIKEELSSIKNQSNNEKKRS